MNPMLRIPIRWQLIIIAVIVALPAAGIIISSGVQQRNRAIKDARMDTQRLVDRIASEQRILVASARQLVVPLSQLSEIEEKNAAKANQLLSKILKLQPNFANIFIADRTGTIWASAVPFANPITINDRRYFKNALTSGQLSSGEFQIARIVDKSSLNLGYPYRNNHGEIIGVLCVVISLEDYGILLKRPQLPDRAGVVLIDHKGVILFSSTNPEKRIGKLSNPVVFKKMLEGPDADTSIAVGIAEDSSWQERYVSYQKLRLEGEQSPYMYVRVGIPVESVLTQANEQIMRNISLFALVLASALFLAWHVGKRSIVDRIALLERASQSLANGDLRIRVSALIKGGELGRLGESFDAMAQQLASREKSLAEKQRQMEELNISLEQRVADAVLESRKKDQILISQGRQAAMGELIGNIAHQWRQPLNTLGLIVQELQMTYGRDEFNKESLDVSVKKAMELISHMSHTIDDFRNFFKPDKEKILFHVNQAVVKILSLVKLGFKNLSINIEVIGTDDTEIFGYAHEYSQVLLNILLNCRDAFEGSNIDRQRVITITVSKEDNKSVVTVADNAGGIPEDIIDKIFDPYFTTKGPDKGTGIGLYMAKTITEKNMGGRLTVRNTAEGAEFRIEV
jgi:C4-dicarboxylate-specific signal transduction histidine kinase